MKKAYDPFYMFLYLSHESLPSSASGGLGAPAIFCAESLHEIHSSFIIAVKDTLNVS
jgi:hypothetical protein